MVTHGIPVQLKRGSWAKKNTGFLKKASERCGYPLPKDTPEERERELRARGVKL